MSKLILIVLALLIVVGLVIVFYRVPLMRNPAPDYYTAQGRSLETDGPNTYRSRVPIATWLKIRNLDF
jgi:hypothetical protein